VGETEVASTPFQGTEYRLATSTTLLDILDDMLMGGASGGQRRQRRTARIRFRVWGWRCMVGGRASVAWVQMGLGLGFGQGVVGDINRHGRPDWAVPLMGRAAHHAMTGRCVRVPGRAT
jgi:hypothetical protein